MKPTSQYADNTARLVPGYAHLQQMTALLLAEKTPTDAHILVLGAGGGQELKTIAEMQPTWTFDGVDPSTEMLDIAKAHLGPLTKNVTFHEGYIDTAPAGPYDAATCLLTLHFLPEVERRKTVTEIFNRLKPGAPLVTAHHSFPTKDAEKTKWLNRYAAFAIANGVPASQANNAIKAIGERLPILSPDQDEAILRDAGFTQIEQFYAAFTFKGWVSTKS